MIVIRKLAVGLLLAGGLTCAALSAPPQNVLRGPGGQGIWFSGPAYANAPNDPAQLAHQYLETKKEDEKKEIRKRLTDVLNQQFDQHIKSQQNELDDLEKQIAKLREVIKKRLEAKSTIVDRRVEQLIQDAEGLGWNAPSSPRVLYQSTTPHPSIIAPLLSAPSASAPTLKK